MARCILCGGEIPDAEILEAKGLHPPKYCETCRRAIRSYRPTMKVERRQLDARIVRLGAGLASALRFEREGETKLPDGMRPKIYSLGGRNFGPRGGAAHSGKTLVYVYDEKPQAGRVYLFRKMLKIDQDSKQSWIYLVLEPTDEDTPLVLDFHFTRVFKYTLKGFGQQIDRVTPLETPHEVILEGRSGSRSGRYGNHWVVYIREEEEGVREGRAAEAL